MPKDRQYRLIKLFPKEKTIGIGVLNVDEKTREASFFEGQGGSDGQDGRLLATLYRSNLNWAAAAGIQLSGFDLIGFKKHVPQYVYQEWFLAYI